MTDPIDHAAAEAYAQSAVGREQSTGRGRQIANLARAYLALVKDRERLDFLINDIQFDSIGGFDVHEEVDAIVRESGRTEADVDEYPHIYMLAYRRIIDKTMEASRD